MKSAISEDLKKEMIELKGRALKIGYKNVMPKLPKEQLTQKTFDNLMIGFSKRLDNWKGQLIQLENPGGLYNGKKRGQTDEVTEPTYISSQFVMSDLSELVKIS